MFYAINIEDQTDHDTVYQAVGTKNANIHIQTLINTMETIGAHHIETLIHFPEYTKFISITKTDTTA